MCSGCGSPILDQFILRVAPDLEWHASCLKCADCGLMLEEMRTCFVRDGKTYCKMDYLRYGPAVPKSYNCSSLFAFRMLHTVAISFTHCSYKCYTQAAFDK